MATTIIAQPQVLMPAYNPIKYIIDNTNKNEPGFRYIFTIYPAAGSHIPANVVAQYRVLPVFGTGYGEQDISRLMQSLVTWNFTSGQVNESWYQYDIDLGYEFIDNIDYTLALEESAGGDVEIHFAAHGFVAGDQVVIVQDGTGPVDNPTVEGLHTVLYADTNYFVINARWDTVTDEFANGNVSYADQRKTQVLDDELIEDQEVFNGAYSLGIYAQGSFPSAEYLGTLDPSYALTSLTNPNTSSTAASIVEDSYGLYYIMCRVYSGVTYSVSYYNTADDALIVGPSQPDSPANGLWNFFVGYFNTMTGDFYVEITGDNGSRFRYYFQLDTRCFINYDTLYYLDRMGSWQSFAFQLKTYEKGQISREMYNQHVDGQVVSNEWEYSSDAMGSRTYNINVSNTLDLNTNWMDQYNANRFQELLTSPQVFYVKPDDGNSYACTVEATGFENFRQRNKNLIKQSVTIKLALNTPING
jgi:hypothetical protein